MNFKKITRNPIVYVLLVGLLLVIGFSLISNLSGARQVSTKEGLDLLKGGTVTQVVTNDPDQRVDLTLSQPFEGANDVQFYFSQARADEVASAIDAAAPTAPIRTRAGVPTRSVAAVARSDTGSIARNRPRSGLAITSGS